MVIINRIGDCDGRRYRLRRYPQEGLTIHKFGVPGVVDAKGIAEFLRENQQYTGGQMAYTFVILPSGAIEQALQWQEVGPHAMRWNSETVGIAAIGDFGSEKPPAAQWASAVDLCADLCAAIGISPLGKMPGGQYRLAGHTERPDATQYPDKRCPGRFWDMDKFRATVSEAMRELAVQRLVVAGAM